MAKNWNRSKAVVNEHSYNTQTFESKWDGETFSISNQEYAFSQPLHHRQDVLHG